MASFKNEKIYPSLIALKPTPQPEFTVDGELWYDSNQKNFYGQANGIVSSLASSAKNLNVIYATDYGVKGGAIVYSDASWTNGSRVVTIGNASFPDGLIALGAQHLVVSSIQTGVTSSMVAHTLGSGTIVTASF
jgi:hypothetical protein